MALMYQCFTVFTTTSVGCNGEHRTGYPGRTLLLLEENIREAMRHRGLDPHEDQHAVRGLIDEYLTGLRSTAHPHFPAGFG